MLLRVLIFQPFITLNKVIGMSMILKRSKILFKQEAESLTHPWSFIIVKTNSKILFERDQRKIINFLIKRVAFGKNSLSDSLFLFNKL